MPGFMTGGRIIGPQQLAGRAVRRELVIVLVQGAERAAHLLRVVLRVVERPLCPAHDVHLVCVLDPWRASPQEHQAHETDPERPAEEEKPEFGHGAPLLPQRQLAGVGAPAIHHPTGPANTEPTLYATARHGLISPWLSVGWGVALALPRSGSRVRVSFPAPDSSHDPGAVPGVICFPRLGGRVVMQRPAKPSTPVRFRP
jgi:hypothetical protein